MEQSSVIWHSTLAEENQAYLERVQKIAYWNILKEKYISYEQSLHKMRTTLNDKFEVRHAITERFKN